MKIFLGIAIFVFILGLIKLKFELGYKNEVGFFLRLKILFLKLFLYPPVKTKTKIKKEKPPKKKKKDKTKKRKLSDILSIIKIALKPVPNFFKCLNRGLKIKLIRVQLKVAGDDACETALAYVKNYNIFNGVLLTLNNFLNIEKQILDISPDFLSEKSAYDIFLAFNIRIGRVVVALIKYILAVMVKFIAEFLRKSSIKK